MTLLSAPGSDDPEADLVEEANALLKTLKGGRQLPVKGRTVADKTGVLRRAYAASAVLNVQISVPLAKGADYVTALANKMSQVFKAVTLNRDKIRKLEPKTTEKHD